jgi:hypothetical protein
VAASSGADETAPDCNQKSNKGGGLQQTTGVASVWDVGWISKTSALVGSADAEGQGQSVETQSVRRRASVVARGAEMQAARCTEGGGQESTRERLQQTAMGTVVGRGGAGAWRAPSAAATQTMIYMYRWPSMAVSMSMSISSSRVGFSCTRLVRAGHERLPEAARRPDAS